jgi:hypothetical protein
MFTKTSKVSSVSALRNSNPSRSEKRPQRIKQPLRFPKNLEGLGITTFEVSKNLEGFISICFEKFKSFEV